MILDTLIDETEDDAIRMPILSAWSKDLKLAAVNLGDAEARYLVDYYYEMQHNRIRSAGQIRSGGGEPNAVLQVLFSEQHTVETRIKQALDTYTNAQPLGVWVRSIVGIGPVIAAGMLANFDVTGTHHCRSAGPHKCDDPCPDFGASRPFNTVGKLWSYAGLNPEMVWEKGMKRPYNARFKTLVVYKAGESFIKCGSNEANLYAPLYYERKRHEQAKNETGGFAELAAKKLSETRYGKDTQAHGWLSKGMLAPGHLHARARRRMVKLFLAHFHEAAWFQRYKTLPPLPYVFAILGHADEMAPPNTSLIAGWTEARKESGRPVRGEPKKE